MLLELTILVCEFNAASDSKDTEKSFSIDINKKTFAVCKWDDSVEKPKIIYSFSGGLVNEYSKHPKQHIQNVIYVISNEVKSMKSKGE